VTDMRNEYPGARADAFEDTTADVVDRASEQSFHASDPLAWTLGLTAPSPCTKGSRTRTAIVEDGTSSFAAATIDAGWMD